MVATNAERMLWTQAEAHAAAGEWSQAKACFLRLLELRPRHQAILTQLSYTESLAGHYRDARLFALEAARAPTQGVQTASDVVSRLRTFNEPAALKQFIASLGPRGRIPIPLLISIASSMSSMNMQEEALGYAEEALRADPGFPTTLLANAQILMYLGRFRDARPLVERCLAKAPEIAHAWWLLSSLGGASPDAVTTLKRMLPRAGAKPADAALVWFALHNLLDELRQYDAAADALAHGTRLKRSLVGHDRRASEALFAQLETIGAGTTKPGATDAQGATGRQVPVFITGMHRSGTTLLEQLLDGHSDVKGIGELYDFTSAMRYATDHHCRGVIDATIVERAHNVDFAQVGQRYLDGIQWRLGEERHFTDKLPSNFLNIGFICRALPQARILHMVRDPIETCFSNLRELFSDANPYSYDQLELADYYRQYRGLMAHWHRVFPGRILDVDYAQLTRDPEIVLRGVCDFIGIAFEPEMLNIHNRKRGVSTASAVQVRQAITVRDVPKWKPYEAYLQPLIGALRADGFV